MTLTREEALQLGQKLLENGYLCLFEVDVEEAPTFQDNADYWSFQNACLWPSRSFEDLMLPYAIHLYRRQQQAPPDSMYHLRSYEINRLSRIRDVLVGMRETILTGIQTQTEFFLSFSFFFLLTNSRNNFDSKYVSFSRNQKCYQCLR